MNYLRLFIQTIKVFLIFTGCTVFFYYAIMWLSEEYENRQRYDQPEGDAVKVISYQIEEDYHWFDRLVMFYLNGE